MNLLSASGGLIYHWRALRFSRQLWRSYQDSTAVWLEGWRPQAKNLVLIGASGGYALNKEFLARFEKIGVVDPDPWAKKVFRFRFAPLKISWSATNYFKAGRFRTLSRDFPDSAFLFSNILGQLPLMGIDLLGPLRDEWRAFLNESEWASFHDLWSTDFSVPVSGEIWLSPNSRIEPSVLHFAPNGVPRVVRDHMTKDLFRLSVERAQWLWRLKPGTTHCIEGVRPSKHVKGT